MNQRFIGVVAAVLAGASAALYGSPAIADAIRDKQWHLGFLNVSEAHQISTGMGVTVAVVDTGVSKHPDLSGTILKGTDFVNRGGSGQIDVDGHGTAMAGLIAAHGKNGHGALGIAPDAKILPIRVLKGGRTKVDVGPAINYAITHGAKVINLSVGGGLTPATLDAVDAAAKADVVVIAAAGNRPEESAVVAPAFLDSVVAVSAVDRSGKIAPVSVSGPEIDISAPGQDMESTYKDGDYMKNGVGTSDATAIVSGAAALLRSKYPDMTANEVVQRLESTATDKGAPGVDDEYGHGVVNIVAALAGGDVPVSGSSSGSSSQSSTNSPTPASTVGAAPDAGPVSNATPLLFGGLVLLVLLGGFVTFLALRRKAPSGP